MNPHMPFRLSFRCTSIEFSFRANVDLFSCEFHVETLNKLQNSLINIRRSLTIFTFRSTEWRREAKSNFSMAGPLVVPPAPPPPGGPTPAQKTSEVIGTFRPTKVKPS